MFDFAHPGQPKELVLKHLKDFEEVSAEANRDLPTQAKILVFPAPKADLA